MADQQQVVDQMQAHGLPPLPPGHPVLDGKIHRYGPKKKAWYALREIDLKSGERIIGGAFGVWRGDDNNAVPVAIDWKGISPEERAAAEQKQREFEERERIKRERQAENAANRAKQQWGSALTEGASPYLQRKKVTPEGVRFFADGTLLVPMVKYHAEGRDLVGLQKIAPDGAKRFNSGMEKIGSACKLGRIQPAEHVIGVVEGYATGRSVRMAANESLPVVVAFDAGNLLPVAKLLRLADPEAHLLFFADDDFLLEPRFIHWLAEDFKVTAAVVIDGSEQTLQAEDGTSVRVIATWRMDACGVAYIEADVRAGRQMRLKRFENAGMARAKAAARAVGNASVVAPVFADRGQNKWTDFNDLHCEESFDAVRAQVAAAILAALATPPAAQVLSLVPISPDPTEKSEGPGGPTPPLPGEGDAPAARGKGKKEKVRPQSFWDSIDRLLDSFVMLYGTDTAWDEVNRMQIKISALRLAYGNDAVKFWLGNSDRRMINYDRLVFDPTSQCDEKTHVNLYEGFAVTAKQGCCVKIVELLLHLCNGDEDLFLWVMRWIAYPLRHPGAKMTTSIVMHGDEGSGKNLFWEDIVCALYGKYGGVIGNAQIETQYNEWVSQKLFFVCDEVVTRNEMKQLKGKLKALISGKRMNVNPKHLPERSEANHINFAFLSNELQPLALDHSDRRYLVAWTPPKQDLAYYKAIADEASNGGLEAFYHFLLHGLDMGDFNEHTKPMDTEAKQDLITLSLDAPERFFREWSAKALPLPFITCGAMQLYWAFLRWCHLNGERFPPTHVLFARKLKRYAGDAIRSRMIEYDLGSGDVKQRTVYLIGEKPEGKTQGEWAEEASRLFDKYLKKYRNVCDQSEMENEA
jgi:putative DNA primase/helicase